jgi:hypothetical protein
MEGYQPPQTKRIIMVMETVAPDVARISEGLRDTGYDFNTAVADIIDNSIAAGATFIDVRIGADFADNIILSVGDNGEGMDRAGLINAMKYGSRRRPSAKSLGKFGLGLKTASTAFCRRLSLISRTASVPPLRATWDLNVMAERGWELELVTPEPAEIQLLDEVAPGRAGTVVLWEEVDRLLETYKDRSSHHFKKAILTLEGSLRTHLATVYQRFLDPADDRDTTVCIQVNGKDVEAWDPFCIVETKAPVAEQKVTTELADGTKTFFTVRAFILPRKEEFSSDANRNAARISNDRHGIYVYRENRLIHGPDWMRMFKADPHDSLLRVELSFDHTLDDAFQVDIKKSRILLNESLYEFLRDKFLAGPRREANQRYRRGAATVAKGAATLLHTPASNMIEQKAGALTTATLSVLDEKTGKVAVNNKAGSTTATLRIAESDQPGPIHVMTSETLENGVLWEPTLGRGGAAAVALNTGHPFYSKAYLPNKANSPVIQSLDYLLWALAQAELNNLNEETRDAFEEFRVEVSRNLKKLVADLPDSPETVTE